MPFPLKIKHQFVTYKKKYAEKLVYKHPMTSKKIDRVQLYLYAMFFKISINKIQRLLITDLEECILHQYRFLCAYSSVLT